MEAVILAAGEGKRMWPLTSSRPKAMLPLMNLPILEHLIKQIARAAINEIIIVVGYCEEAIKKYFGDGHAWGVRIDYISQQERKGTADALGMLEDRLPGSFLVFNGDIIVSSVSIEKLIASQKPAVGSILLDDVPGRWAMEVDNTIMIYGERRTSPSHIANAGLYYLDGRIFNAIARTALSSRGEYELSDSLQVLIDAGVEISLVAIDRWFNLAYPWTLLNANQWILESLSDCMSGQIEEYACIKGKVSIGEGTVIHSGSYIAGPVVIGKNCEIGPNSGTGRKVSQTNVRFLSHSGL